LHDLSKFLERYETPRPTLKTLSFLLFDHIGGINTLLHTLFNKGCVVSIWDRSVSNVLRVCRDFEVEVIPTTPTFLRMMLMSGLIPDAVPDSIRLITYGTERMDQHTLSALCEALPGVDFRQTFGMSEIGIVRVKSEARDSLWMKIGGEGVETRVRDGKLYIRSASRMLGYLNAESPFDEEGWYDTKDLVETRGEYLKVVGRTTEVINVGGLKFMASEVELIALSYSAVELASAKASPNPITGQHVELQVQVSNSALFSKEAFIEYLKSTLPRHMVPARVFVGPIEVGHRHKKA
jgi:acyl-CoA synthetase (AMP-forming)/AMP-acid ligase II